VDTVFVISIDLGINFLSLHFQMPYLKSSKISSRSVHSLTPFVPYQKIVFKFGSFPRTRILDSSRKPFKAVLVTGQSKNRCLKFSFWLVSGFNILQNEHLSFTFAKKWAVLLYRARQLLRSLNRNYLTSFCKKLRFQRPRILPRCSGPVPVCPLIRRKCLRYAGWVYLGFC
jgi:hypothetical protein